MDPTLERRHFDFEIRTKGRRLSGYAATFNTETRIDGQFSEIIRPHAFAQTLQSNSDVLALVDHDPHRILARTRSGTLRLSEDSRGLQFDIDVPDTSIGRDLLALAERDDLGGMSFGFTTIDDEWTDTRRELRAVNLFEVSVISAWPAYPDTSVSARSRFHAGYKTRLARRKIELLELIQ